MTRTIIIDVDGVLTDGKVWYTSNGERSKGFHSRDIRAIRELTANGYDIYLLTQSTWPGVEHFANRTGATIAQVVDKLKWIQENHITDFIAFADDVADVEFCKKATQVFYPKNADANFIKKLPCNSSELNIRGGEGVIAEYVQWFIV